MSKSIEILLFIFLMGLIHADPENWWKHSIIYQIYPRSFKDYDNDGIGDLRGIIDKLDFFPKFGVDAIWLSPVFKSPQVDQGYDISDYRNIDKDYGTLDDMKELIEKAHAKNIKIFLDFVPNHTSDQHQWFIDSVNGTEGYEDFYVWHNGTIDKNGQKRPPNNWISVFKNSAWTWNCERDQYYLHQFDKAQPDLNFRNPEVLKAIDDVMLFWLDFGVDGFRIDAIIHLLEVEDFRDEPLSNLHNAKETDYGFLKHVYTTNLPETFDIVYHWRQLIDNYTQKHGGDAKILMTEAATDLPQLMLYYGTPDGSRLGAHFSFNFNLINDINSNSTAEDIAESSTRWLKAIPSIYTSNWVLGNHDTHRASTKFGPANTDGFNMLKFLLPGVNVIYNGEEIGQENGEVSFEQGHDPSARNPEIFDLVSRDFQRTPYQWDDSINAGFNTGAKTWLPVSQKYKNTNLKKQEEDEVSHFKVMQALAKIKNDPILIKGVATIKTFKKFVILVSTSYNGESMVLIFNKGSEPVVMNVEADVAKNNSVIVKSINSSKPLGSTINRDALELEGHEAIILKSMM